MPKIIGIQDICCATDPPETTNDQYPERIVSTNCFHDAQPRSLFFKARCSRGAQPSRPTRVFGQRVVCGPFSEQGTNTSEDQTAYLPFHRQIYPKDKGAESLCASPGRQSVCFRNRVHCRF